MRDYIAWYLVEIERAATKHVSADRVKEIQREVLAHLEESKRAHVQSGDSEHEASRKAVLEFGPVRSLFRYEETVLFKGSQWVPLAILPLYIATMTLAEVGVRASFGFVLIAAVILVPFLNGLRSRTIHIASILVVPAVSFVFLLFALPAWFVDAGAADGYRIFPRALLASGHYDPETIASVKEFPHTYWEQFVGFLPSALVSFLYMFLIVATPNVLGVWLGRLADYISRARLWPARS